MATCNARQIEAWKNHVDALEAAIVNELSYRDGVAALEPVIALVRDLQTFVRDELPDAGGEAPRQQFEERLELLNVRCRTATYAELDDGRWLLQGDAGNLIYWARCILCDLAPE